MLIRQEVDHCSCNGQATKPRIKHANWSVAHRWHRLPLYASDLTFQSASSNRACSIGGGTAYVNGYRHSFGTSTVLDVNKSTATRITEGQTVNTAYGNYFVVDEFCGAWNLKDGDIITLHNSAKDAVTNTTYGTTAAPISSEVIGQARVKHIVYDTGTIGTAAAQYRIYLYDIRITKGELKDVRGVYYSNSTDSGFADVVLEGGNAVVKESAQNRLVFRAPYRSAKTLAAAGGGTYDTQYYYQ